MSQKSSTSADGGQLSITQSTIQKSRLPQPLPRVADRHSVNCTLFGPDIGDSRRS